MSSTLIENLFVSEHWGLDHCDPAAWTYEPSTYGVEGVELVGSKEMKLWSELNGYWVNPGRKEGTSTADVFRLKEEILENGIKTKDTSVVYYDVDTNQRVNGGHRNETSDQLNIPGWMMQGVRFANEVAKIKFATKSNNRKNTIHKNSSEEDVKAAVREIVNLEGEFSKEHIKELVADLGWHFTDKKRNNIVDAIFMEIKFEGKCKCAERYSAWNGTKLKLFVEHSEDPWFKNVYNNDCEYSHYVNGDHFEARVGPLLKTLALAMKDDKPLHIIFSVSVENIDRKPLDKRREDFWNDIKCLENRLIDIGYLSEKHRKNFAGNHLECAHRTLPQDNQRENENYLIKSSR